MFRAFASMACVVVGCGFGHAGELDAIRAIPPTVEASIPAGELPVAVAARVERLGQATRLSFDVSRPVTVQSYAMENPDRIVIESSAINFQIENAGHVPDNPSLLIKSFRFGQFAAGKSRIVIDLTGPAQVQKLAVASIAGGDPSRLTVQLTRCDRASFHATVKHAGTQAQAVAENTARVEISDQRPVVVIDPGHGGIDPGAKGIGGIVEKSITMDFANALASKLRATGHFNVVLTRAGDSFVSLSERVRIAREARAQLLVSIHADTVPDGSGVTGATVYTVSDRASDAQAARVAESENKADEMAGVETPPEATEISDILFDLTRRETRTFSHTFQRTLVGYWQKIARLNKNPERGAGFMVLKAPDVPSVLLELGYLSSETDVAALTSTTWRETATASVSASIESFFAAQGRTGPTVGVQLSQDRTGSGTQTIVALKPHL